MGWFKTRKAACIDKDAVCAYEYEGELYRTKESIVEAKMRVKFVDIRRKLGDTLYEHNSMVCNGHSKMISIFEVVDFIFNNWNHFSIAMTELQNCKDKLKKEIS